MNITRENYEVYIIDYLDGKLNPVQSAELMNFLSQNPDLEEEFNEFENIRIDPSKEIKPDKEKLKRNFSDIQKINDENFDEFCVAKFEGDLNEYDEIRLEEYLKEHPEKQKDFNLYSKTYLSPDYNIIYPEKNNIKKISPFIRRKNLLLYATSVAAAILLLVLLVYMPGKDKGKISEIQVADNITEENISSQQEYENNTEVTEKLIPKEKKYIVLENIQSDQIPEKISFNLLKGDKYEKRVAPEYITPISPQIIASVESTDLMIYENINTTGNLYANKYLLEETAEKDEETERYISIYGINISKIDIWRLAEAGIKGFNYLTESELLLNKKMSKDGEVVAFALNSETFSISSPLKK
jgi:hypothetical protein